MNISECVDEIKAWTKENAMPLYKQIAKGATKKQMAEVLEECVEYKIELPEYYLEWLSVMNGQKDDQADERVGLIPTSDSDSYFIYGSGMILNDLGYGIDFLSMSTERYICGPELQQTYYDRNWVRIATDWDSALAIDLNPSKKGIVGQIIVIDYCSPVRHVVCKSFEEFLTRLAEGYKNDKAHT